MFLGIVAIIVIAIIVLPHSAFAAAVGQGGFNAINFGELGKDVDTITGVVTGPLAKLVLSLGVIAACWAFSNKHAFHDGMHDIGVIMMTIGLVMSLPTLFNTVAGAII